MMTLTKYGFREWGTAGLVTVLILVGCVWLFRAGHTGAATGIGVAVLVIFFCFAAFFRNPSRRIPEDPKSG